MRMKAKVIQDVVAGLVAVEKANRRYDRQRRAKASWDSEADVAEHRKLKDVMRAEKKIPKTLKCPVCRRFKPDLKQWALDRGICRSCAQVETTSINVAETAMSAIEIFTRVERWKVDSGLLRKVRVASGLSQAAVAELCGWSQAYQSKLESGAVETIQRQQRDILLKALKVNTLPPVVG